MRKTTLGSAATAPDRALAVPAAGFDYGALSTLTAMVVLTIAVDFLSAAMRRSLR